MKNNTTYNVVNIVLGCTVLGAGAFLARIGYGMTARGVLPYLRRIVK